ncbi:MAG: hypothetical protein IPM14_04715 [bacterium]|nr:hypothetical protein [bacterium]
MNYLYLRIISVAIFIVIIFNISVSAQTPRTMSYQGVLTDTSGNPVPNGTYQLFINFYNVASGGSSLATRGPIPALTSNGLFNIIIGNGEAGNAPLNDFNINQQIWMGVKIGSNSSNELLPRAQLTGTFYSFHSDTATYALNSGGDLTLPYIGSTNSTSPGLSINNSGLSSSSHGLMGTTLSSDGLAAGVYGKVVNGNSNGVFGESNSSSDGAAGVWGYATSSIGETYGVVGQIQSNGQFSAGVRGITTSSSGFNFGVEGVNFSNSQYATGVTGYESGTTGETRGVVGEVVSQNQNAFGVMGIATAPAIALFALGNFVGTGTKSAVVPLDVSNPKDVQSTISASEWRLVYNVEGTEVWFQEMGFGNLQNGKAVITIDPLFQKIANLNVPYHVIITPYGSCNTLSVISRTSNSFTVEEQQGGNSTIEFSYCIYAKRLGYENERLELRSDPYLGYRESDQDQRKNQIDKLIKKFPEK